MYKSIFTPSPPFCYAISPQLAVAANSTVTPQINISNDCDFEISEIRAIIHKAAAFSNNSNVLVQMSTAAGELFSNVGVDMLSFASVVLHTAVPPTSGYPIRLDRPIRVPANSQINVQITNNNNEVLVSVQLQLWGTKVPMKRQS